jgi:hypothetical protein
MNYQTRATCEAMQDKYTNEPLCDPLPATRPERGASTSIGPVAQLQAPPGAHNKNMAQANLPEPRRQEVEMAWTRGIHHYERVCRNWGGRDVAKLDIIIVDAFVPVSACRHYDATSTDADEAMCRVAKLKNRIDEIEEDRQRRNKKIAAIAAGTVFILSFLWLRRRAFCQQ